MKCMCMYLHTSHHPEVPNSGTQGPWITGHTLFTSIQPVVLMSNRVRPQLFYMISPFGESDGDGVDTDLITRNSYVVH